LSNRSDTIFASAQTSSGLLGRLGADLLPQLPQPGSLGRQQTNAPHKDCSPSGAPAVQDVEPVHIRASPSARATWCCPGTSRSRSPASRPAPGFDRLYPRPAREPRRCVVRVPPDEDLRDLHRPAERRFRIQAGRAEVFGQRFKVASPSCPTALAPSPSWPSGDAQRHTHRRTLARARDTPSCSSRSAPPPYPPLVGPPGKRRAAPGRRTHTSHTRARARSA